MRFFQFFALSALMLLVGTSSAWAYQLEITTTNMGVPYAGEALTAGVDQLTLDVFLDVVSGDPGPTIVSIGVVYDDDDLVYNPAKSLALTPKGPGTSGAQPSYVLYTGGKPPTYLVPLQTPYFVTFPAPTGTEQVNVTMVENALEIAVATGTGVYIASIVLDAISGGDGSANISMEFTSSNLIQSGTFIVANQADSSAVTLLGTPVAVTVPEPAVTGLALAGLGTLFLVRALRRRALR